ncbi:MAG: asparagine synthase (glutamine-hydrolyzing) [Planctomycetia bacterium]|nr:asparagine synthase (glutamine-hydrolyzing) [Planctomycetia bacterium]
MCGICGICYSRTGRPAAPDVVASMAQTIVHRGPDDQGVFVDGYVGLGMRRLSIIDLETGAQPMFSEDRNLVTVFNGEIYNFQELRRDLTARGHTFRTSSDTEVILHLYQEHGLDFVRHLNGMFAIALWDRRVQRLVLVRDRLGQKPLYYAWLPDGLVFGSELKCLFRVQDVPLDINPEAVLYYFSLGYIPHPHSIYADVRQLAPGERLVVHEDRIALDRYWTLDFRIDVGLTWHEAQVRLRDLLTDSVRSHMVSDVPLGAFLSGGLDSSIIVALMAKHSSQKVKTFHITFDEEQYSEKKYARAVAERYDTDHHELTIRPSALDVLDDLAAHFDEPFGDASAVPTYYVSKLTREHVTVALAGDGGDECFGGYDRYSRILGRWRLPSAARSVLGSCGRAVHACLPRSARGRRLFRSLGMSQDEFFAVGTQELEAREFLSPDLLATLGDISTIGQVRPAFERASGDDPLLPYTSFDMHYYLPDDILTKVDRMSMANSLEVRAPFLDHRIVELSARLPHDWKIRGRLRKYMLRRAFANDLPSAVLEPRKQGFSIPLDLWLQNELRPALTDALNDKAIRETGFFNIEELRLLAREHWACTRDRQSQLWWFLFFTRWWHLHHGRLRLTAGRGLL